MACKAEKKKAKYVWGGKKRCLVGEKSATVKNGREKKRGGFCGKGKRMGRKGGNEKGRISTCQKKCDHHPCRK